MRLDKNLRFEELAKALERSGYAQSQSRGGGSHFVFRKIGRNPISLPKATPMKRKYIEFVRTALLEDESEA